MVTLGTAVDGDIGTRVGRIVVIQASDASDGVTHDIHCPVHHLALIAGQLVLGEGECVSTLDHVAQGYTTHLIAGSIVSKDEISLTGIAIGFEGECVTAITSLGTAQVIGEDTLYKRCVDGYLFLDNAERRPGGSCALVVVGGHGIDADILAGAHEVASPVKCHLIDGVIAGPCIGGEGRAIGCKNRRITIPSDIKELQYAVAVVDDQHIIGVIDGKAGDNRAIEAGELGT